MPRKKNNRRVGVTKPIFKEPGDKNKFQKMRDEVSRILMRQALVVPNAANRHQQIRRVAPFTASYSGNAALMRNARKTVMKRRSNTLILKTSEDPHLVMSALNDGADARVVTKDDIRRRLFGKFAELLKDNKHRSSAESYAAMLVRLINYMKLPARNANNTILTSETNEDEHVYFIVVTRYFTKPTSAFFDLLVAIGRHRFANVPWEMMNYLYHSLHLDGMWPPIMWGHVVKVLRAIAPYQHQEVLDDMVVKYFQFFPPQMYRAREVQDLFELGAQPSRQALVYVLEVHIDHFQNKVYEIVALFRRHGMSLTRGEVVYMWHHISTNAPKQGTLQNYINKVRQLGLLRH